MQCFYVYQYNNKHNIIFICSHTLTLVFHFLAVLGQPIGSHEATGKPKYASSYIGPAVGVIAGVILIIAVFKLALKNKHNVKGNCLIGRSVKVNPQYVVDVLNGKSNVRKEINWDDL